MVITVGVGGCIDLRLGQSGGSDLGSGMRSEQRFLVLFVGFLPLISLRLCLEQKRGRKK